MKRLLTSASIGAIIIAAYAGTAVAQTTTTASSPDNPRITCGDLASLDAEKAEGVLYFLAGWQAAQESGLISPAASATIDSETSDMASDAASTETEETASTSSAAEDMTASISADNAAATGDSGSAAADETEMAASSADTSSGDASVMASVEGWTDIDVEQVMSDCQGDATKQVVDVLGQHDMDQ